MGSKTVNALINCVATQQLYFVCVRFILERIVEFIANTMPDKLVLICF